MGVLHLFRAICMTSTELPIANKNYYCSPQVSHLFDSSKAQPTTYLEFGGGEYSNTSRADMYSAVL